MSQTEEWRGSGRRRRRKFHAAVTWLILAVLLVGAVIAVLAFSNSRKWPLPARTQPAPKGSTIPRV